MEKAFIDDCVVRDVSVNAYTVPTDFPESDGTLTWDKTTLVLVHAKAGDKIGIGYTYADIPTANLIKDMLIPLVQGKSAWTFPPAGRQCDMPFGTSAGQEFARWQSRPLTLLFGI